MRILSFLFFLVYSCASSLPEPPKNKSHVIKGDTGKLASKIKAQTSKHPGLTGAYPLAAGTDAFLARVNLIKAANKSIDMQYYIYNEDVTGKAVNYYLLLAAQRGVRIRMLLDDLSIKDKDDFLKYLNTFKNVEVRLFNPSPARTFKNLGFLFNFKTLNHRMHNKTISADGRACVIGGRNVGDEYFSASHELAFGDFDLLLIGEAADQVGTQFDLYWNSPYSYAIEDLSGNFSKDDFDKAQWLKEFESMVAKRKDYQKDLEQSSVQRFIKGETIPWYWGRSKVMYDDPEKISGDDSKILIKQLKPDLQKANADLLIISPYFIPGDNGSDELIALAKKGVKVRIVTNSLASTDVVPVYSGFAPYRKRLIEAGIELYEMKVHPDQKPKSFSGSSSSSLHAKTMIIDSKESFVGSINLDPRSARINTEIGILLANEKLAKKFHSQVLEKAKINAYLLKLDDGEIVWEDLANGTIHEKSPDASWFRRVGAGLFRFLPVEGQL